MGQTPEEYDGQEDYDRTALTLAFIRADQQAMREVLEALADTVQRGNAKLEALADTVQRGNAKLEALADTVQRLDEKTDRIATEVHEVHGKVDALTVAHEQLRTAFDEHTH